MAESTAPEGSENDAEQSTEERQPHIKFIPVTDGEEALGEAAFGDNFGA